MVLDPDLGKALGWLLWWWESCLSNWDISSFLVGMEHLLQHYSFHQYPLTIGLVNVGSVLALLCCTACAMPTQVTLPPRFWFLQMTKLLDKAIRMFDCHIQTVLLDEILVALLPYGIQSSDPVLVAEMAIELLGQDADLTVPTNNRPHEGSDVKAHATAFQLICLKDSDIHGFNRGQQRICSCAY